MNIDLEQYYCEHLKFVQKVTTVPSFTTFQSKQFIGWKYEADFS